jgi:hypothetical protein
MRVERQAGDLPPQKTLAAMGGGAKVGELCEGCHRIVHASSR